MIRKLTEIFKHIRDLVTNDQPDSPIEIRGGEKGGFGFFTIIDKKQNSPIAICINPLKRDYKGLGGNIGIDYTGLALNSGLGYSGYKEYRGPIVITNPRYPNIDNILKKNSDLKDILGYEITAVNIYLPKQNEKQYIGNYIVDITNNEIKPNIIHIKDNQKRIIKTLLALLYDNFLRSDSNTIYRLNVMFYNDITKKLKIYVHYLMENYVDADYELDYDKGCAGTAFKYALEEGSRRPVYVDLIEQGTKYAIYLNEPVHLLDENRRAELGHEKYGVKGSTVWQDMRSIVSVPIFDSEGIPLGTLNVDCNKRLNESILKEKGFNNALITVSNIIGNVVDG